MESRRFTYKRCFANKVEQSATHQAFYLPAGERRGIFTAQVCGYLRQHYLQTLCFAGSETPPYFRYIYFVPSLAIAQIALLQEILTPAPWHTPARCTNFTTMSERLWETIRNSQKHCGKPGGLHSQKLIQKNLYRYTHLEREHSSNTYIDRLLSQG